MNAVVLVEVTLENQEIRQRYCKIFDLHHIIAVRFGIVDKGGKAFLGLIGFAKGGQRLGRIVHHLRRLVVIVHGTGQIKIAARCQAEGLLRAGSVSAFGIQFTNHLIQIII